MSAISPIITVDGPSGAGKGTLCQALADAFGWHLLDSGAIYRVLGCAALRKNIAFDDEEALAAEAAVLDVRFEPQDDELKVMLGGDDITRDVRSQVGADAASKVAAYPKVRDALMQRQRDFAQAPGLIADGRDMGTVVFPEAPVKIFLDASAEERAKRRMNQLQQKGFSGNFEQILSEIQARDYRDRNRAVAPLVPASDALLLDSTSLSIEEVIKQALDYAKKILNLPA